VLIERCFLCHLYRSVLNTCLLTIQSVVCIVVLVEIMTVTVEIPRLYGNMYNHIVPCYCALGSAPPLSVLGTLQTRNNKEQLWRNKYLCVHFPDPSSSSRFIFIKNQMPNLHLSIKEIIASQIPWTQPIATFFTINNPTSESSLHLLPKLVLCFSDDVKYYAAHRIGAKKKETFVDPMTKSSLIFESRSFEGFPETLDVLQHLRSLTGEG
jgi:hypothetical protein